jgi:hypothetical protein
MKKLLFILIMLFAVSASADPKVVVSVNDEKGPYVIYKVVYTSDGTDAAAVDLVAKMDQYALTFVKQGVTAMVLSAVQGAGAVAPDNAVDVIFTDSTGMAVKTTTGNAISNVANTLKIDMSDDLGQYPYITSPFYITVEDVGTAGDQYTFYLRGWIEKGGQK